MLDSFHHYCLAFELSYLHRRQPGLYRDQGAVQELEPGCGLKWRWRPGRHRQPYPLGGRGLFLGGDRYLGQPGEWAV